MIKLFIGFMLIMCLSPVILVIYSWMQQFDLNVLVYGPLLILSSFLVGHLILKD